MASPWKKTAVELPDQSEQCYIRLSPNYGPIIKGEFDTDPAPYAWKTDGTNAGKIPAYMVARWKNNPTPSAPLPSPSISILPWHYTVSDPAANNQYCLIRIPGFYGEIVGSSFRKLTGGWVFEIFQDPDFRIPWYLVPRWRLEP